VAQTRADGLDISYCQGRAFHETQYGIVRLTLSCCVSCRLMTANLAPASTASSGSSQAGTICTKEGETCQLLRVCLLLDDIGAQDNRPAHQRKHPDSP
jgi:hypothetical protein